MNAEGATSNPSQPVSEKTISQSASPAAPDQLVPDHFASGQLASGQLALGLLSSWQAQVKADLPDQLEDTHRAIARWLVGSPERFEVMSAAEVKLAKKAMDYRYRILISRYWGLSPERGYKRLLTKLGGLFLIRSKIRTWIALSRDRKRAVKDVLQEVIQEMLQSDRHMQQQTQLIRSCTQRGNLRNILTLATIEEYCLRPIRNQPLLVYRFVNYLRRSQRGGMTQVPSRELIQLISEEIGTDDSDGTLSLLDFEALDRYEQQKSFEEQQVARQSVKDQFSTYLVDKLGDTAAEWLELHLQGYAQENISQQLGLNVREAYRLREKVSYHAIRIFTIKERPDLVFSWLKTSLKQHNFGLTPSESDVYYAALDEAQKQMLNAFKSGSSVKEVAKTMGLTEKQTTSKWADLYLKAQELRSDRA